MQDHFSLTKCIGKHENKLDYFKLFINPLIFLKYQYENRNVEMFIMICIYNIKHKMI